MTLLAANLFSTPSPVDELYAAICEGQALNPPEDEEDDEEDGNGGGPITV